ncbi:hypothetical protein FA15DRAFT_753404 [Coprinopsis marcescibilis]|uniref:Mid2 domain-containing protein n=1 Tax=Coprinopsis marcescibilis TaxID=230819 RepID=A0A5C3L6W5_COPMA|nr:hypothetical protein FA15DRAFT_753404 [Coprinopsis marcescibilis]
MFLPSPRRWLLVAPLAVCWSAQAFEFTIEPQIPTQCGTVTVSWSDGQAPFNILVIPPTNPLLNISVTDEFHDGESGSFELDIPFGRDEEIIFAMSDRTGVTAGGVTKSLRIGVQTAGQTCELTRTGRPDFFFSLEDNLRECAPYTFSGYGNAVQPITVYGFVPGGGSFEVEAPLGDTFRWTNTFHRDTEVVFFVKDARNRNGGASGIKVVGASSNTTCLSPIADTKGGGTKGGSNSGKDSGSGGTPLGAIIGGAVGGVVFLAIVIAGIIFYKKKQKSRPQMVAASSILGAEEKFGAVGGGLPSAFARPPGQNSHTPSYISSSYQHTDRSTMYQPGDRTTMFSTSGASSVGPYGAVPTSPSYYGAPTMYSSDLGSNSGASGIAPYGGYQPPIQQVYPGDTKARPQASAPQPRIIVHQDIADISNAQHEEPVEELPPQYSDLRAPLTGLQPSAGSSSQQAGSSSSGPVQYPPDRKS